ncbi:TIGR02391 family protein [Pseudomonas moraviensis]|uniref:TIGR02391 family protein n=1 Tax=Pseudomonas moraviensis TaxID=321662 RepID=UPI00135D2EF3|nr:TIGR02391 family protein [Pseudomonas moraviensis]MXI47076.1 TIGR02391 family protein [Pseudomonas moraviensis]
METSLEAFELIVRRAKLFDSGESVESINLHPFDQRNVHQKFPQKVRKLFDNGHCAEATFEAFKYVDKVIQKIAKINESGYKLMMKAFNETNPIIKLTNLTSTSEIDEQKGYSFLFSGSVMAIRNPRGHDIDMSDDPDVCLDHLALASLLLRRLEQSSFVW